MPKLKFIVTTDINIDQVKEFWAKGHQFVMQPDDWRCFNDADPVALPARMEIEDDE